ncbi:hypothetical protein DsansV1_C29g0208951 [Dioscorea sansibarensis]
MRYKRNGKGIPLQGMIQAGTVRYTEKFGCICIRNGLQQIICNNTELFSDHVLEKHSLRRIKRTCGYQQLQINRCRCSVL